MSSYAASCRTVAVGADEELRREAAILAHCRHPGVVDLRSVEATDEELTVVVAAPAGVALGQAVLTIDEVAGVSAVLATTVADLHDIGVAHGAVALDAVTLTDGGRPVLGDFSAAQWLDGSPGRWPGHPLAQQDDRALGGITAALLERCAPLDVLLSLDRPRRAPRRRLRHRRASGAAAISAWAAAASAGEVRARRFATAMAEEMPDARLPDVGRARPADVPDFGGDGPADIPDLHGDGPADAPDFADDGPADAAIDAWLSASNPPTPRGDTRKPPPATPCADTREPAPPTPRADTLEAIQDDGGDGMTTSPSHPTSLPQALDLPGATLGRGPLAFGAILAGIGLLLALTVTLLHPSRPRQGRTAAVTPPPARPAPSPPPRVPPARNAPAPATRLCLSASAPCTAVTYEAGVLTVGSARFAVGRPGDVVATGRWTCGATPTLALLRPATSEIWVFPAWPGGPQSVTPIAVGPVAMARTLAANPDGACDTLLVTRADGTVVDLGPWTA